MQNTGVVSENATSPSLPLPPPPPPPTLRTSAANNDCIIANNTQYKCLTKKAIHSNLISALRHITHLFDNENPTLIISLYKPVSPMIQEGRCCGIVALSMASQLIQNTPVDKILERAKALNFTNEGELFSAFNMATLATTLFDCDARVIDDLMANKNDILHHVCDGWPLLIPYDADKNHFPCINKGQTAHWAVITGICFSISGDIDINILPDVESITEFPELKILVVKDSACVCSLLKYATKLFMYAHQGKSKHLAAWDFDDLLLSNKNLYEVTKKYSSHELVLPENDSLSELRNKAVLLKKKL